MIKHSRQNHNFKSIEFIKELIKLAPRLGKNELKAAKLILKTLERFHIIYTIEEFETVIPKFSKSILKANGKIIKSKATSFRSGMIIDNQNIISSLTNGKDLKYNINFNPNTKDISQTYFYNYPSLAIIAILKQNGTKKFILNSQIYVHVLCL